MSEYLNNDVQTVPYGGPVILNTSIGCTRGFVFHRPESGILSLRGIVNNPCAPFARYLVDFNANIAVPTGGTTGEISVSVAISGEPIPTSMGASTPAVADVYNHVSSKAIIDVPRGCCFEVSVENTSETAEPINVRNANLIVTRIA